MLWGSAAFTTFWGMNRTTGDKPKDLERNSSELQEQNLIVQMVNTMDCVLERTDDQSYLFSELRQWIKNLVWCLPATPGTVNNAALVFCTPPTLIALCAPPDI